MSQPDLNLFFWDLCSAFGWDVGALTCSPGLASGTNPPYSAADFFGFYPKFGGRVGSFDAVLTANSAVVTGINAQGLAAGMLVTASVLPPGTVIVSVDGDTQITLSQGTTADGTSISVYSAPLLPMAVINAYIALASASLMQVRWQDAWQIGMALYIAHFCTLWLRSDGDQACTPGQAAVAGLARGITVSKGAAGVSASIQPVEGLEEWGALTETEYGVQLATLAKTIGMGAVWFY